MFNSIKYRCMMAAFVACLLTGVWFGYTHYNSRKAGVFEPSATATGMPSSPSPFSIDNNNNNNNNNSEKQKKGSATIEQETNLEKSAKVATDVEPSSPEEQHQQRRRPNVLFLVCDDLNDYVETMGGHPQAITPNIRRLMESSVSFTQAHANMPLCKESRASFLSGLYPHSSKYLHGGILPIPDEFEGLKHQRTLIEHFNENDYVTMGTGKIYHGYRESFWKQEGPKPDYGPFACNITLANEKGASDKTLKNMPHPYVPSPFRDRGPIRGSFGPLEKLHDGLTWRTGNFVRGFREIKFPSTGDRDMTTDERIASWAVQQLQEMDAAPAEDDDKPFFLGVGLVRPHHPMIVPTKYFDMYPLKTLEMPPSLRKRDGNDTMRHTLEKKGIGKKMYHELIKSFGFRKTALRRYLQAYLASVTAADELIGQVLDALDQTRFKDNTIVVFTSDHGYEIGQKDYLGKNLLWQSTTRVPLVVRVPGMTSASDGVEENGSTQESGSSPPSPRTCDHPVSLVDLYPTLIDLCGLSKNTAKDRLSKPLDGHSLRPFLSTSDDDETWDGPDFALSTLSYEFVPSDSMGMSLATRYDNWRYIRYSNGKEELYNTIEDPYEWTNLVGTNDATVVSLLDRFRADLFHFVKGDEPSVQRT